MKNAEMKQRKYLLVAIALILFSIILMAIPGSLSLTFRPTPDETAIKYISYSIGASCLDMHIFLQYPH